MNITILRKKGFVFKKIEVLEVSIGGKSKVVNVRTIKKSEMDSLKLSADETILLDGLEMNFKDSKKNGKTTRMVDKGIQEIFLNGFLSVSELASFYGEVKTNLVIFNKIKRRLKAEHSYYYKAKIVADENNLTFKLV